MRAAATTTRRSRAQCHRSRCHSDLDDGGPIDVTIKADPAYAHRWLVSESADAVPVLGAQLSEKPNADLTIYWSGHPGRKDLFAIVDEWTGFLRKERREVEGWLVAYGQDMRAEFKLQKRSFAPLGAHTVAIFCFIRPAAPILRRYYAQAARLCFKNPSSRRDGPDRTGWRSPFCRPLAT